jgi:hypothetical protein
MPRRTRKAPPTQAVVAFVLACHVALAAADTPDITVTPIARDGQGLVSFELSDGFTADVRDAIQSGLPTTFSYEVELRRQSSTWFDRTVAAITANGEYYIHVRAHTQPRNAWFVWPWDRSALLGRAKFTFIP